MQLMHPTTHSSPIVSPNDYSITMGLGTGRWSAQSRAIAFAIFAQKNIILSLHQFQDCECSTIRLSKQRSAMSHIIDPAMRLRFS